MPVAKIQSENPKQERNNMSYRGSGMVPFGLNTIPFGTLRREIDRLFEDTASGRSSGSSWIPAVNIREGTRETVSGEKREQMAPSRDPLPCHKAWTRNRSSRISIMEF